MQKWYALEKGPWRYACLKICLSSHQYMHGVASWLHDTLPCILITAAY